MTYNVVTTTSFDKQFKRLSKKYFSIRSELADLAEKLSTNPDLGISLGRDCYKIRLSIASKGKGKSGGARVITNFAISDGNIILLSIYDKSEQTDITEKELLLLLDRLK